MPFLFTMENGQWKQRRWLSDLLPAAPEALGWKLKSWAAASVPYPSGSSEGSFRSLWSPHTALRPGQAVFGMGSAPGLTSPPPPQGWGAARLHWAVQTPSCTWTGWGRNAGGPWPACKSSGRCQPAPGWSRGVWAPPDGCPPSARRTGQSRHFWHWRSPRSEGGPTSRRTPARSWTCGTSWCRSRPGTCWDPRSAGQWAHSAEKRPAGCACSSTRSQTGPPKAGTCYSGTDDQTSATGSAA